MRSRVRVRCGVNCFFINHTQKCTGSACFYSTDFSIAITHILRYFPDNYILLQNIYISVEKCTRSTKKCAVLFFSERLRFQTSQMLFVPTAANIYGECDWTVTFSWTVSFCRWLWIWPIYMAILFKQCDRKCFYIETIASII